MSRVSSKAPGAMHGVSQIEGQIYFNKPLGPSSAEVKHPKRRSAAGTTPEIALHQGQMRRAWAALSHPYVRMCFNEMVKRLLAGSGIVVYHGSEPKIPCNAFRTILTRDFIPFSRDALDHIMAFGIVPIAFRKVVGNGLGENELVPYVPKFGTYTISTWTEAGLQQFRFYWAGALPGDGHSDMNASAYWLGGGGGPFGDRDDRHVFYSLLPLIIVH